MEIKNISIIKVDYGWNVIADGHIADGLSLDEVLGQVAYLLITGKAHFHTRNLAEPENRWTVPKALLTK